MPQKDGVGWNHSAAAWLPNIGAFGSTPGAAESEWIGWASAFGCNRELASISRYGLRKRTRAVCLARLLKQAIGPKQLPSARATKRR